MTDHGAPHNVISSSLLRLFFPLTQVSTSTPSSQAQRLRFPDGVRDHVSQPYETGRMQRLRIYGIICNKQIIMFLIY